MSRTITSLTPTNTFQDWYDKTNEVASSFAVAVTIGDNVTNAGNVIIAGDITSTQSIKTDVIEGQSIANNIVIDVETISLEGSVYYGSNFIMSRNVDENALSIGN